LQALANFTKSDLDTMGEQLGRDMFRQIQHLCNAHSLSERAKWLQQVEILENLTTPQLARRVASAMKTLALGLLVPSSGRGVESLAVAQPVLALLMATRHHRKATLQIMSASARARLSSGYTEATKA
jgi:hypothetical protein